LDEQWKGLGAAGIIPNAGTFDRPALVNPLSRPLVNSSPVTVELRNRRDDPPGVYCASAANLSTGRYRLVCSLPGHEALGMSAVLRVE
jgi:hypothetical protein